LSADYFRRYFIPTIRDDFEIAETHVYQAASGLPVPLVALAASCDAIAPVKYVLQWEEITARTFCAKTFDGSGHFFIHERRAEVLAYLQDQLADIDGPPRLARTPGGARAKQAQRNHRKPAW
jgi:surfactin synthase thioesterase subunit